MFKIKYIIAIFIIFVSNSYVNGQKIDLNGDWSGNLSQPNDENSLSRNYTFEMKITQKGDSVWGTTRIEVEKTNDYAVMEFTGKLYRSILKFQETKIIKQNIKKPAYWCIKSGSLKLVTNQSQLVGKWNSTGGCGPGDIYLYRKEIIEEDELEDSIKIEPQKQIETETTEIELDTVAGVEIIENKLQVENIYFDTGKYDLTNEAKAELNKIFKFMVINNDVKIFISGYTDNVGDENELLELSEKRVEAVINYLIEKGIDEERISGKGYGSAKPLSSDDTKEGHAKNRRIEFEIIKN